MNLNSEQKYAVDCNDSKIVCLSGAGTGKTTVMIARISRLISEGVDPRSMLALTFTNVAAFEMKERFKKQNPNSAIPEFRTFHSFCYNLLCRNEEVRKALNYSTIPAIAPPSSQNRVTTTAALQMNLKLSKAKLSGKVPMTPKEQYQYDRYNAAMRRLLFSENMITFDVLCYDICKLFKENHPCVDEYKKRFKYIFVDEFQDTDIRQWEFVQSFQDSNLFVVGDALQCQPAGTLVTMSDMTTRPIQELKVGDYLLTYTPREGRYIRNLNKKSGNLHRYTKRILSISTHFAENIVKVSSENHSSCYTKDHITYARIHYEGNENVFVTYIMSNDRGWFRVGSTKLFLDSQNSAFGPRLRLQNEHGNRVWILGVYNSAAEAWLNEQIVAYKFGIPQATWNHENTKFGMKELESLYSTLGDLLENAEKCLKYYHRDIQYPLFTSGDLHVHFSKLHMFECRVGNLIPGIFDIVYPSYITNSEGYQELRNAYEVIQSIVDVDPQIVYGLDVEDNHNYVADGILTHNCIYAFRGANSDIIKQLSEDNDWTAIKLAQNYRSTQQICDFANDMSTYADDSYRVALQAVRSGENVDVWPSEAVPYSEPICENNIHDMMDELKCIEDNRSIAILCRTNNEVDRICQELSRCNLEFSRVKATSEVDELLNSCTDNGYLADWLSTFLVAELYSEYIRTRESHKSDSPLKILIDMYGTMSQISYRFKTVMMLRKTLQAAYEDKVQKLSDICKLLDIEVPDIDISGMTGKEVIEALKESLQNPSGSSIYVGTIHSVKGLEFDDVYLIGVNDISFKLKNEENNNLYYVGITRAKNHLTVCYRKGEYPYDSANRNRAIAEKHSHTTIG